MVEDRLQDVSRSFLGPRRAIAVHDEVRLSRCCVSLAGWSAELVRAACAASWQVSLLSSVLYNALTTGHGTPTLGEEYSDLHAVRGGGAASAPFRAAHSTTLPGLAAGGWRSAAAAVAAAPRAADCAAVCGAVLA